MLTELLLAAGDHAAGAQHAWLALADTLGTARPGPLWSGEHSVWQLSSKSTMPCLSLQQKWPAGAWQSRQADKWQEGSPAHTSSNHLYLSRDLEREDRRLRRSLSLSRELTPKSRSLERVRDLQQQVSGGLQHHACEQGLHPESMLCEQAQASSVLHPVRALEQIPACTL